ncbi:unnamed protein product [Rotaria socialis]|uniref:Peptidase C1A papain C-terminal domain-containing protein n=1 Tax=Rotaria socialis TaxID=392032 RepID=A0A821DJ24_9BILA|nr:unnamed protein product [Rotaria socialis]
MAEKVYLVNPETGSRHRLNDCKPCPRPSSSLKFSSSPKYRNKDLPKTVDLSSKMTPVETQEDTAACVGNALAAAYEFLIKKKTGRDIDVSRLFIYYNGRVRDAVDEGIIEDSGCSIAGAIEGLKEYGCCKEDWFPYDIRKVNQRPPKNCYDDAIHFRITHGLVLKPNLQEMKVCLAQGYPFVFGLKTFKSFSTAETNGGLVPMPEPNEDISLDHYQHAMLAVGYDDKLKQFIVKNSWGPNWVSCVR